MAFLLGAFIGGWITFHTKQAKAETTDAADVPDALRQKWTEIEVTGNPAIRAFWRKAGEMAGCGDVLYWRFENTLPVSVTITYNVKGKWKSNGGELSVAPKWTAVLAPSDQRQQSFVPAALDQMVCAYKFVSIEVTSSNPPPDFSRKKPSKAVVSKVTPAIASPPPSKEVPDPRSNATTTKQKLKCLTGKKVYAASCYCPKGTETVLVDKRSGIVMCKTVDSAPLPPPANENPPPTKKVVPQVNPSEVTCGG